MHIELAKDEEKTSEMINSQLCVFNNSFLKQESVLHSLSICMTGFVVSCRQNLG